MVGGSVLEAMWWVGRLRRLCVGWLVNTDFKAHSGSQHQLSIQVRAECDNIQSS